MLWNTTHLFRVLLVLAAIGSAFADPGERVSLETRVLHIKAPNALEAVNLLVERDLFKVIRDFQPRVPSDEKRTISLAATSFAEVGPRGLPRLVMPAQVDAIVTTIDATVRGDIEIQGAQCRDKSEAGRRIVLDLRDSAEALQENARVFEIKICWAADPSGEVKVTASSAFEEGSDFGFISGPKTVKLLKAQTAPILQAFKVHLNRVLVQLAERDGVQLPPDAGLK